MMLSNKKTKRFFFTGLVVAIINFLVLAFLVEVLGFSTYFLKNAANIMAMEIAVILHFFLSRHWTWQSIPKKKGKKLVTQFFSFHLAVFIGIFLRTILFAVLEKWKVYYLFNVAFGIGLVTVMNYILFDRFIFRKIGMMAYTEGQRSE